MGWVLEERRSGLAMASDKIGAESSSFYNSIRTAFSVCKLSDSASGGITVDLYFSHDKVANSEGDRGTRFIGVFYKDGATLFSQETENLLGKLCS